MSLDKIGSKILIKHIDYKDSKNFEQMITIYSNKNDNSNKDDRYDIDDKNRKPIFVFMMGSAWMGHFPLLYYITNYWNSSIMKNLTKKGYTCISIRHRGAFFKPISLYSKYSKYLILFLCITNVFALFNYLLLVFLWNSICNGSADYTTILKDVHDSLTYIDDNYETITSKYNGTGEIVLAGYSSGVHVLHNTLISPNFKQYKNISIKKIVYISGVLNIDTNVDNLGNIRFNLYSYIVNVFLNLLFSSQDVDTYLRSPILTTDKLPDKKYYIIGCKNEFLNIPFVKSISEFVFCSTAFSKKLNLTGDGNRSKYIEFNKNHWNLLNYHGLTESINCIIKYL